MSTLQMAPAAAATACATMQRLRRGTWMVPGHAKGGMKQQLMAAAVLHISNLLGQAQPAAEDQHVYKMPADASDDHIWEEQLGKGLQAAVAAHVQHIFQRVRTAAYGTDTLCCVSAVATAAFSHVASTAPS
jgi:hypothetical protein